MKNRIIIHIVFFSLLIAADNAYPESIQFSAESDYFVNTFVFEKWFPEVSGNGDGSGSRHIYRSTHRLPVLRMDYLIDSFEFGIRYAPQMYTNEGRGEDIDYSCNECKRYGPPADLKTLSVSDRMERDKIQSHEIWSHSYTDRMDINYTATEAFGAWFPNAKENTNTGLFFKVGLSGSHIRYNMNNDYNVFRQNIFIPVNVANTRKRSYTISAETGYKNYLSDRLYVNGSLGISGGEDTIDLEYRLRWLDLRYKGYGTGFYWTGELGLKINPRINAIVKVSQKHYFGRSVYARGFVQDAIIQEYGLLPLMYHNGAYYSATYGTRANHFTAGVSYAL